MSDFPHYSLAPKDLDANIRFRVELLEMVKTDKAAGRQLKRMCAEDMLFYVNAFCFTFNPRLITRGLNPRIPFITYDFQDDAMSGIKSCVEDGRDFAMPKSRDMGASWMGLTVFEWFWHFKEYMSFLLTSRNESYVDKSGNSKALFWKVDFLHDNMPRWLLPTGRWLGMKDPERKLLHLGNADNGSVIDGEATTENIGVGDRRTAIFVDEFGAFNTDDGYSVLRGTRDVTDCRGFNSTPRGQNAFYDVVHKTNAEVFRLHWSVHPEKAQGSYTTGEDGQVELLDDWRGVVTVREKGAKTPKVYHFPETYPFRLDGKLRSPWYDHQCNRCASPSEIAQELDIDFLGSEYQFFDAMTITELVKQYCRPPLLVGDLEFDLVTLEVKRFHEHENGSLLLWVNLDADGRIPRGKRYVIGSDVSAGTGASNSVSSVVDAETGEKVGVWRDPNTRPTEFCSVSVVLAKFFNNAFMIWDATGPTGKTFTQQIMKVGYGNIYYRRDEKKVGRRVTDEPGYYLQPEQRAVLLQDYRSALDSHNFTNPSESGMSETLRFMVRPGGLVEHIAAANSQDPSGARTAHGDECIADALASKGVEERAASPESEPEDEPPVGSLAWRRKCHAEEETSKRPNRELDDGW